MRGKQGKSGVAGKKRRVTAEDEVMEAKKKRRNEEKKKKDEHLQTRGLAHALGHLHTGAPAVDDDGRVRDQLLVDQGHEVVWQVASPLAGLWLLACHAHLLWQVHVGGHGRGMWVVGVVEARESDVRR